MLDGEPAGGGMEGEAEYALVVQRYRPAVRHWLYATVGPGFDLDDMCQCVFIRAYSRRCRFDAKRGSLSTWLRTISHNVAVSFLRSRKYQPDSLDAMTETTGPSCAGPDEEHEVWARALEQLDKLTPEERDVVILRVFLHVPWAEIAEEQGCSLRTAHNRFSHALLKLTRVRRHEKHGREAE
jgi:RNA polymerase sigma-70 factor (ECF subfamily)